MTYWFLYYTFTSKNDQHGSGHTVIECKKTFFQ